ncbi:hypothetical protein ASG52_19885 [Methylobacterium sp. Leaf456]|uniref:DUF3307 domain-containing protein n=1 Tax=Methylobacterium sp. Leaf456 TaxID=1736382 RepID=UPI000701F9C5|nr:DUF3307 domain-containing protein [Methylobacterium sp. Leaf456]KQT59989.1 hypothetical protein ASG52_19885 [Methylobacterium sp. Leaf456]
MFTADQIVAHLVGDYLLQSHWMATEKTKRSLAAAIHAVAYTVPFAFITLDPLALTLIAALHFPIDRWRLARFVVWLKNGARGPVTATGYTDDVPPWLAVWLLIIADNVLHILINGAVLALV